ncbi:MAG TPA: GlcNAc-transferase family protein [Acetobacteraceae bacterium]|nr:GlcNAc-transferase family protein [Acetobacteraceae bacterium]
MGRSGYRRGAAAAGRRAGGFVFGPSRRLTAVPYGPHIYFLGEEINLSVRLRTTGWDWFVPNQVLAHHHYAKPGARSAPWRDDSESGKPHVPSEARLRHLFGTEAATDRRALADLDRSGLSRARPLAA